MAGNFEHANPEDEIFLQRMIAGEIEYAGEDDDVSSYLNPSGDGMEVELLTKGKQSTMTKGKQTSMARYIYIEPLVTRCIK